MKLEITNSQRMALIDLLVDYMRRPDAIEMFVDCSHDDTPTTMVPDLLNLFLSPPLVTTEQDFADRHKALDDLEAKLNKPADR